MNKKARALLSNAVRFLGNRLDNLKMEHDRTEAEFQVIFRRFATDKQFPIADRFHTWSKHCVKVHSKVAIRSGEFGLIGEMVDASGEFRKEVVYTWEYFLDLVTDRNENPDEHEGWFFRVTVDEFKEVLIAENFGSFKEDF